MPTGHTAGILDGTTKTFKDFAKSCMRSFGAVVHMRDEPDDKEYTPRTPSTYHVNKIKECEALINLAKNSQDEAIVAGRKTELQKDREYHLKAINKNNFDAEKINAFIADARKYNPPTKEHEGIKKFMIEQLQGTLDMDCNNKYHTDALDRIDNELQSMTAESVRESMLEKANKEFRYHREELRKEIDRCNESNLWVAQFIESL